MVVNIDNHDKFLSPFLASFLPESDARWQAGIIAWPRPLASSRENPAQDLTASTSIEPALKADAEKRGYNLGPVAGAEMEMLAKEVMNQPPAIIQRLNKVLANRDSR